MVGCLGMVLCGLPLFGFFIGQIIAEKLDPAWGFWVTAIADIVLCSSSNSRGEAAMKAACRERLSGWSRSRVERGELALVIFGKPPKWWWEEV